MKTDQFDKLMRGRRFGQAKKGRAHNRTLRALRYYLVDGRTAIEACATADNLSPAALYAALKVLGQLPRQHGKVKRASCPHCGQPMPNNRRAPFATPKSAS